MKYYCNTCGAEFDEPKKERELHTELDEGNRWEEFYVCPECGEMDFVEMETCDCCRERKPSTELLGGKNVCDDCRLWVVRKLGEIFDEATGEFDMDYMDAKKIVLDIASEMF